ncbi:MAG: cadherin domain-containing protein [Planctomycetota bacterium]|nr:cadherin domain-containing protein [Planctomycetota bacterium]
MKNVCRTENHIQKLLRSSVQVKRACYRRLLRLESLETRTLMAADGLVFQEIFSSNDVVAEGEELAPTIGYMPPEPPDLVGRKPANGPGVAESIPAANTFFLHSRPTAKKTIYLDFDGFTARGTSWNTSNNITTIVSPAWDPAGNGPAFTNNELNEIQGAWQRVAADYAAFDVDVTTEDPGEANLVNTGGSDDRWGIRVVNTLVDFSNSGAGGFAYIGSFRWGYERSGATDTPAYVFNRTGMNVAAAVSHEVGHSLGLSHDGTNSANPLQQNAEYYDGHGTGENSWGPIMGSGYYRNVTTWDDGTYIGTSNGAASANFGTGPTDLATITQASNGFGFVPDADGNTSFLATTLVGTSIPGGKQSISKLATIEQPGDFDFFKFQTGAGVVDITIDPYVNDLWTSDGSGGYVNSIESSFLDGTRWNENQGSNLDVEATLYDDAGNVIAVSNPAGLRASFSNLSLRIGTYYIRVDGVGFGDPRANPPTGYSDYGSLGQYLISGTIASSIEIGITDVSVYIENTAPIPIASNATVSTFNINTFDGGILQFAIATNFQVGDKIGFVSSGTGPGQISFLGSDVLYGGVLIGTFTSGLKSMSVYFNAASTKESLEAVIRALTFEHTSDAPLLTQRQVSVFLDNANNGASNFAFARVGVIPVNDSPLTGDASLQSVAEDTANPSGQRVSTLMGSSFTDVDIGSALSGIAITANSALSGTGIWQYSINGVQWAPIGTVSATSSLLLSKDTWIRFLPALNFNGTPAPLRFRGIDDTFVGTFSTRTVRSTIDVTTSVADGPLSLTDSSLRTVITPVNDAPISNVGAQVVSVDQDQTLTLIVPTAWFSDVDNTTLAYSMARSDGSALPKWLSFDPTTRRLVGSPKNADVGDYSLIIRATDSAGLFATISLFVTVANVNDAPIAIQLAADPVVEGDADLSGKFLGTLFASDPDSKDEFIWTVTDPRFEIRGNTLFLAPGNKLDYEAGSRVSLTVQVTDTGIPPLSYEQQATIDLIDVNEFAPALRSASFSVNEGVAGSTILGVLEATDGDTANKVRFRFLGTPPSLFSLNPDTGEIRLAANGSLNHESASSYQFFVEAVDNGIPQLATTASVNIVVRDVNEFDPQITTSLIRIPENQVTNGAFAKVIATDLDTNQFIRFSLPASETRFSINPVTGDLSLVRAGIFDFETKQFDSVVVLATDSGTPARKIQRTITIAIDDANDPPTGASVADPKILSNVSGLNLGVINVVDQDVGQKYSIVSLDDRFVVVNGNLTVAPGKSVGNSDALQIVVPIIATEVGTTSSAYPLSVNLVRTPNPRPWQNQLLPQDVDRIGGVNPLDVLAIVNAINGDLLGSLPFPRPASTLLQPDYDVDADGSLTPLDALAVINFLNARGSGEGEETTAVPPPLTAKVQNLVDDTWLIAFNQLEEERSLQRRKRG